jgi:hypothetical protein
MKTHNPGKCEHCKGSLSAKRAGARYCSVSCRSSATKRRAKAAAGVFLGGSARNCATCASPFTALVDKHIYCTKACARIAYKERHAGWKDVPCAVCDAMFTPNSSMHRICSPKCAAKNRRRLWLARRYALTPHDFNERLARQNGKCAICDEVTSGHWAIDHDHTCCPGSETCGRCIRGILCVSCNQALGLFRDSVPTLRRAIKYLGSNEPGQPGSAYQRWPTAKGGA